MPFRDSDTHFRDILEAIDRIEAFVAGLDLESYRADDKTRSAVERQLQIVTEAARRLGSDANALCPGPDWQACCRMGDLLRHCYHKIDDEIVWNTVEEELPPMRAAVIRYLATKPR